MVFFVLAFLFAVILSAGKIIYHTPDNVEQEWLIFLQTCLLAAIGAILDEIKNILKKQK